MSDTRDTAPKPKERRAKIWGLAALGVFVVVAAIAAWAWNGHRPSSGAGSGHSAAEGPSGIQSPAPVASVTDLLKQAEGLRAQKRLREAEIVLTQASGIDSDDIRVWRALAGVQRETSAAYIQSGRLLEAAQTADQARLSIQFMQGRKDPRSPIVDPKIVVDEEKANETAIEAARAAIDTACQESIAKANKCAQDAFHSSWNVLAVGIRDIKNDRGKVVEGLKHLRPVFEIGRWASDQTRMSANEALSGLKKLVNPDEWNDLLARAGFDPESRDTLKKLGLE